VEAHHQMRRARIREDGAQEWLCPHCGRHLLLQFSPRYQKVVFELGDETAAHAGATDGVRLGPVEVVGSADPPADPGSDWRRWLADNGIDWDGPAA
jgi:hypothetical protein